MAVQPTIVSYVGDGSTTVFNFAFDYLSTDYVKVRVDGVDTAHTYNTSQSVQISPAPANGEVVRISRETDRERLVDFVDGSVLIEDDLDLADTQLLHIVQEAIDLTGASLSVEADGSLNAAFRRIINVGDPVNDSDAVTKLWAETGMTSQLATAVAQAAAALASATAANAAAITAVASEADAEAARDTALASQASASASASSAAAAEAAADADRIAAEASATTAANEAAAAAASAAAAATWDPVNYIGKSEGLNFKTVNNTDYASYDDMSPTNDPDWMTNQIMGRVTSPVPAGGWPGNGGGDFIISMSWGGGGAVQLGFNWSPSATEQSIYTRQKVANVWGAWGPLIAKADQATAEAGTNDVAYMTPLATAQAISSQILNGVSAEAYVPSTGTTFIGNFGFASVSKPATGDYSFVFDTPEVDTDYVVSAALQEIGASDQRRVWWLTAKSTTGFTIRWRNPGNLAAADNAFLVAVGRVG